MDYIIKSCDLSKGRDCQYISVGPLDPQPPPSGGFPRFRSGKGSIATELHENGIHLRPPYILLRCLASPPDCWRTYPHEQGPDSNTIEVFVGRIRKKLDVDIIQTVRGLGYLLTPPAANA